MDYWLLRLCLFRFIGRELRAIFLFCRWLVLDTDTRDLVSMHTDGEEIISNIKYSPGKLSQIPSESEAAGGKIRHGEVLSFQYFLYSGSFLKIGPPCAFRRKLPGCFFPWQLCLHLWCDGEWPKVQPRGEVHCKYTSSRDLSVSQFIS